MRWPLDDEIRWIECRLRDLERGTAISAPLTKLDCRIWLCCFAYKRDGKSYAEIGRNEYPTRWKSSAGKRRNQAVYSLIRRAVNRVELYLEKPNRVRGRSQSNPLTDAWSFISTGFVPIYVEESSLNLSKKQTPLDQVADTNVSKNPLK